MKRTPDGRNTVPMYARIYEQVRSRIRSGELKIGDRIESERQLARSFLADVEVLVKPTARRAQNAALVPAQLDDLSAAACRVRLSAAFLRP